MRREGYCPRHDNQLQIKSGKRKGGGNTASEGSPWPSIIDEALVERMIPLVQRAIVDATGGRDDADAETIVALSAPDVANVLLMILATVMEPAPDCATPRGTRLMTEEAGRELARLIADVRRLKMTNAAETSGVQ